ncbi:MAG: carboxypeptidase-like regulatory domain-containing protein [Candidatus Micrarchaeia archaeon]
MAIRGQGAFEYLLLLGGTVLVATIVLVMTQGSIQNANNTYGAASGNYADFVTGSVNDIFANGSLTHEAPTGCIYGNPACDAGYYCDNGTCKQANALLKGYALDPAGVPLLGVTIHLVGGNTADALTNASGYYEMAFAINGSSAMYAATAARSPANVQAGATVNLTAGFATIQKFTLSYNPASLSGFVRDPAGNGIAGVALSCGSYSATSGSDGSYAIGNVPMASASTTSTLAGSKTPTFVSNSTPATFNAGVTNSQNLQMSYSNANVSGYVRDVSSAGVAGAAVSCGGVSTTTASDGAYSISGLLMSAASSSCTLAASKSGYTSASATATLTAGAITSGQNLAINLIVVGACGSSNGAAFYSAPSSGLCTAGSASALSGAGPWSWTCAGTYGGSTASCYANLIVNGACGAAATSYAYSAGGFSGALCNAGTASPSSPSFPAAGGSTSWACLGLNGGSGASCSASRANHPCAVAGGTIYGSFCRFSGSSCPGGWTQYGSWSTTTAGHSSSCGWVSSPWPEPSCCSTGSHDFSNTAVESCGYWQYCCTSWTCPTNCWQTASAIVTEVGCYQP